VPGSRLDADHPENGVPYSMPKHMKMKCVAECADKLFPRIFFYFFEILFQIRERAQTLGRIMLLQEAPLLRDDPIAHLGVHLVPSPRARASSNVSNRS